MNFEFATATRVVFGPGTRSRAGVLARELGRRALVVTGRDAARADWLVTQLRAAGLAVAVQSVAGEPSVETVTTALAVARLAPPDVVIACGGGSALDTGKALAGMLGNEGELLDYLEIIGRGRTLARPALPFIAIPTTAGTGAEVTRNAVLSAPAQRAKVSFRSPHLLPRVALVDPELTHDLPPAITAATGLDALTQLIEPYVCARANPLTDALCLDGMGRAARSLRAVCAAGAAPAAREDLALASLFGGLALANAGLGAVHGLAGPLGGWFPAPHGAVCAALLPHVMAANLRALAQRAPTSPTLMRYAEVARRLTGSPVAAAEDGVRWVGELVADLGVPRLGVYGLAAGDFAGVVAQARQASSMQANPVALTAEELADILAAAL